ncbi:MAG TPA: hypothetical protein VND64_02805 [Pirellulales bacterium]|nr:hypothetical protein [Pirellulales bacterium]
MRRRIGLALALAAFVAWFPAVLHGQETEASDEPGTVETPKKPKNKAGKQAKDGAEADGGEAKGDGAGDLFEAVKKKKLNVTFVAQNAAVASLTIINITDQPVKVRVPVVVAGTPTTPPGTNATAYFASFGTAPPQIVGGVTSIADQSAAAGGSKKKKSPGRAAAKGDEPPKASEFTLSPGETRVVPVACVGLEFGKPNPLPILPYTMADIETASKKAEVKAMLEGFAQGRFNREIAQLAAWHFNCSMTWDQLAETGTVSEETLRAAMKAADQIEKEVKAKTKKKAGKEKEKDKEMEKVKKKGKAKDSEETE